MGCSQTLIGSELEEKRINLTISRDKVYIVSMIDGYLTTKQASERCGLSAAHIRRLLEYSTIRGVKAGHDWLLETTSLEEYLANRPRPGRKPKRESQ